MGYASGPDQQDVGADGGDWHERGHDDVPGSIWPKFMRLKKSPSDAAAYDERQPRHSLAPPVPLPSRIRRPPRVQSSTAEMGVENGYPTLFFAGCLRLDGIRAGYKSLLVASISNVSTFAGYHYVPPFVGAGVDMVHLESHVT